MRRVLSRLWSPGRSQAADGSGSERGSGEPAPVASPSDPREALDLIDKLVEQFVAEPGDDLVVTDPDCVYAYRFREMIDPPYVWVGWFLAGANRVAAREVNPGWYVPGAEYESTTEDVQRVIVRAALAAIFAGEPLAELACGFGIGSHLEKQEVEELCLSQIERLGRLERSGITFAHSGMIYGPVRIIYDGVEIGVVNDIDIRITPDNGLEIQAMTLEEEPEDG